jgi:two-component system LytT family response regulator
MTLSSPVRVIIIDDQQATIKDLQLLMQENHGFIVVGSCGSVKDALVLIPASRPDLLLLDITLSDGTGFDILQQTETTNFKVIFLTAHGEHAIRAIKFGALDYLLKPIDKNELSQALDKVLQSGPAHPDQFNIAQQQFRAMNMPDRIVLHAQDYMQIVELNEIVYCHSDTGYTTFHFADGSKMLTSKYLKEYEEILPATSFLRVHQSFMINTRFIARYHKEGFLIMKNGAEVPVAARRKEFINQYINGIQ